MIIFIIGILMYLITHATYYVAYWRLSAERIPFPTLGNIKEYWEADRKSCWQFELIGLGLCLFWPITLFVMLMTYVQSLFLKDT